MDFSVDFSVSEDVKWKSLVVWPRSNQTEPISFQTGTLLLRQKKLKRISFSP